MDVPRSPHNLQPQRADHDPLTISDSRRRGNCRASASCVWRSSRSKVLARSAGDEAGRRAKPVAQARGRMARESGLGPVDVAETGTTLMGRVLARFDSARDCNHGVFVGGV